MNKRSKASIPHITSWRAQSTFTFGPLTRVKQKKKIGIP
jgi:hypothetical protein